MTQMNLSHQKRTTTSQMAAMKTMLNGLLGAEFDRFFPGIRVGDVEENVLQIFAPSAESAADIRLHHLDDFAVAAEYVFMLPIRMVNILPAS
jgi:hypothetical protein